MTERKFTSHDFEDFCQRMFMTIKSEGKSRPIRWKLTDISEALYGHKLNSTQLNKWRKGDVQPPPWVALACAAVHNGVPPYRARVVAQNETLPSTASAEAAEA